MNQYIKQALRRSPRITIVLGLVLFVGTQAWADVLGRFHFVVKNAADEKPVAGAKITLKDSANVRAPIVLKTDANGSITTDPIEARSWKATTEADQFQVDTRDVTVVADTTTEVEILVEPLKEQVVKITGERTIVKSGNTSQGTIRPKEFQQMFPVAAGNPQSLNKVLRGNPGMVEDSAGQVHPRGEHSATSIYIDGFRLGQAFQGRAGQVITPSSIESTEVMMGAYAPEYGGETAAILNLNLRAGTLTPFQNFYAQGGSFNTFFGDLAFGGQAGRAYGTPTADGKSAKRFGYFIDLNGRQTDNAIEPPQPDQQTAHNRGISGSGFGNFDYHPSEKDAFSFKFNHAPAGTQIANRTGLPDFFAPFGQGFGYKGHLSKADAQAQGIASQQADGQDDNQKDKNSFGVLSWRRNINDTLSTFLSFGLIHSGLDVTNKNPAIDLNNLPPDNSIEFNPTIIRNAHDVELQGSVTRTATGGHTFKAGFALDGQNGRESYQLIPGSQLAAQDLGNIDPRLAPVNGQSPTLFVKRTGYYNAAYAQDTWHVTSRFTANYGLRLDMYKQAEDASVDIGGGGTTHSSVSMSQLSPRVNLSYLLAPRTVARAAYNRLFITPPEAQGSILGTQIKPETLNQYDVSVERQLAPGQVVKVAGYYKDMRNQIDTGLLVPGTQIGVFTSVQFDRGSARGIEVSYDLFPRNNFGWAGYLAWANSIDRPGGRDNNGNLVPRYNDHDECNVISAGADYTFHGGYTAGANLFYGSGVASSVIADGFHRVPRTEVNLRLATRPDLVAGKIGLSLDVENVFDSRTLINFQSGFSGTRFQQGRRLLLSLTGKY